VDSERARDLPQLLVVGAFDPVTGDGLLEVGELIERCLGETGGGPA